MQDCTILLQQLVVMWQNWLEDLRAWWAEDVAHEVTCDQADHELWAELLPLDQEWLQLPQEQNTILGRAVHAMDDDHWVLDIILGSVNLTLQNFKIQFCLAYCKSTAVFYRTGIQVPV
ncbi:hypothetical protein Y1Q_0004748 [Alligator mississippiensis]|uniref:Uncharacterized protein n=1 Tax=Alligator mississippiensis TaxID=8496 RepID=A0A151NLL9_ALLMI|nr:hypothetical protein Y1Q_0004748 [Alligator mississippiensis]